LHGQLAQHLRSLQPKDDPHTPTGTLGNFGETRGGVRKNGVLQNKSGNISETRKDRGKVTMDGLELTNALSNGTIPTPYGLPFPKIGGSQPPRKTAFENSGKTSYIDK